MSAANAVSSQNRLPAKRKSNIFKRFWKTRFLFALFVPALVFYILFKYVPMWGISLAFFKYSIFGGWAKSEFVGLYNFEVFFASPEWWLYTRNTFMLGLQSLLISFPLTIIFALMLNEVRHAGFKKITQTISYIPHFLSTVVIVGLMQSILDPTTGIINQLIMKSGKEPIEFFLRREWFRPLYLISEIWHGLGWGTIVYLAAISSVDPGLYEAARLDGAGRIRQIISITLPSIAPTVSTMFIMKIGHIMGDSMEKVLLMQSPVTYEVSQTLSTYNYTMAFGGANNYGISAAIGLYASLINLCFLMAGNWVSKKLTENSIF